MIKKITSKDIEHIAKLSNLSFDAKRVGEYTKKMEDVLGYVAMLDSVDITGIEPTSHAVDSESILRGDEPVKFADAKTLIDNAPVSEDGFICVPKVI